MKLVFKLDKNDVEFLGERYSYLDRNFNREFNILDVFTKNKTYTVRKDDGYFISVKDDKNNIWVFTSDDDIYDMWFIDKFFYSNVELRRQKILKLNVKER